MAPQFRAKRGTARPEHGSGMARIQKPATPPVNSKSSTRTGRHPASSVPVLSLQQDLIYRTLDKERREIRLLILEPGSARDPVRGRLEYAFLSDNPKPIYETISYVWGDATIQATIYLNKSSLKIPATAERVLQRMRHPDRTRILWIDSVCINQADVAERGHQVGIMDEIYSNTSQNLIWLGEDDGQTVSALETIQKIVAEVRNDTNDYKCLRSTLFADAGGNRPATCGLSFKLDRKPLGSLFGSPWFSRLWIIQEVCLSPRNLCYRGDIELPFENILVASAWLRHKRLFLSGYPKHFRFGARIFDLRDREHGYHARFANTFTADVLSDLRDFDAQDPRDHFYAVFGLLKTRLSAEQASKLPLPDYTLSLSEAFQQAAEFILQDTKDLKILDYAVCNHARTQAHDDAALPTWIPRWDYAYDFLEGDTNFLRSTTRADGNVLPEILSIERPQGILNANGIVVDKIESTTVFPKEGEPDMYRSFFGDVEDISSFDRTEDLAQIEKQAAIILTSGKPQLSIDSGVAYSDFKRRIKAENRWPCRNASASPQDPANVAARFFEDVVAACGNRAFFKTCSNYRGMGAEISRPGDIVAVLYGCRFPVILRPLATAADEYEFLGNCYVYGIMNGEAVCSHRARGGKDMTFRIR